jgi:thioredoxin reductase (NADPH)
MASPFFELGDRLEEIDAAASYRFDSEQFARAASFGTPQEVAAGQFVFEAGDADSTIWASRSASAGRP